jgi:hypothetical protein
MIDQLTKDKIDNMTYYNMLYHWRFAPVGDAMLQEEIGKYFAKRMSEIEPENHVEISKSVGW